MSGGNVAAEVRELRAIVGALVVEVRQLRADLAAAPRTAAASPVKGRVGKAVDLGRVILAAVATVDTTHRCGGLVSFPLLRAELAKQGFNDRASVDAALVAMERSFRIDLKIANDPRIPDAAEGIDDPGRGLIFYAVHRPTATQGEG